MKEQLREKVLYKDLPKDLFTKTNVFTSDSTVGMVGHRESGESIEGLYGSGSLVAFGSILGILTAKHVWDAFEKNSSATKVSFSIVGYPHYVHERKDHLRPYFPKNKIASPYFPDNEIDICFLQLPFTVTGTIGAHRTFFPIVQDRLPSIAELLKNLFVTVGFPYERQEPTKKLLNILRYYTHVTNYTEIDEVWDVIELEVDYTHSNVSPPSSFEGMSGGGTWNFNVLFDYENDQRRYRFENIQTVLVGVNFWQTPIESSKRLIRAVGPRSIYLGMTKLIELEN